MALWTLFSVHSTLHFMVGSNLSKPYLKVELTRCLENNGILMTKAEINHLEAAPWARGKENSDNLWDLSEQLVQQKFSY